MFRNATIFRFPPGVLDFHCADNVREENGAVEVLPTVFEQSLTLQALKPVGPLELASVGFVSPYGASRPTQLTQEHGNAIGITVGTEDKILPAAAVNAELAKRIAAEESKSGAEPARIGGRARKRMREDLIAEMLPKALVRPTRTDAIIDRDRGLLFVDTASRRRGEMVVSQIRHAIGSFPGLPLNAEVDPRAVLTGWLAGDPLPGDLTLGDAAILRDPADSGARVRLDGQELQGDEVRQHLEAGKQCKRLSLWWRDLIGFSVDEDLTLRGLRYGDLIFDELENTADQRDSVEAELDARFVLQVDCLRRVFDTLESALRLSKEGEG